MRSATHAPMAMNRNWHRETMPARPISSPSPSVTML
jgi:hypothetical protein